MIFVDLIKEKREKIVEIVTIERIGDSNVSYRNPKIIAIEQDFIIIDQGGTEVAVKIESIIDIEFKK